MLQIKDMKCQAHFLAVFKTAKKKENVVCCKFLVQGNFAYLPFFFLKLHTL